jgi:hydrogenase expression/formation protein HypD
MKFVDEYRDRELAQKLADQIRAITTKPWTIMEVCGGQTHAIVKYGIDKLLPSKVTLVHGPGCPVCVTPLGKIDKALKLASMEGVIFASFGDMLRVPGTMGDLLSIKAQGGDVRIVYSPLDALDLARRNPGKQVIFFAVGFETTAPANAMVVHHAYLERIANFSILVSHVLVPPAMETILSSPQNRVQGFLAAGHVCTIMGVQEYLPLVEKYKVPIVVTGFEPVDILQGILLCIKQLEEGRAELENQYSRVVKDRGNLKARELISTVFQVAKRKWRGIGEIEGSGLELREVYQEYDAELRFSLEESDVEEPQECISGLILQGLKKPGECPAFGSRCKPEHPLGATMVSSEGACAAYYCYRAD